MSSYELAYIKWMMFTTLLLICYGGRVISDLIFSITGSIKAKNIVPWIEISLFIFYWIFVFKFL